MEHASDDDHVSTSSSPDQSTHDKNSQLREENKSLKAQVAHLQMILNDISLFDIEKPTMLEALDRSCAREQELKERVKEEERETESILDALADLRYILQNKKVKQTRLEHLKRSMFSAKCALEDMQFLLTQKEEVIVRRNAEIDELLALYENCFEHMKATVTRIEEAQKTIEEVRKRGRLRLPGIICETCIKEKETAPAPVKTVPSEERPSEPGGMQITLYSLPFIILLLFFAISSMISAFSSENTRDISCIDVLLNSVEKLFGCVGCVYCAGQPLF